MPPADVICMKSRQAQKSSPVAPGCSNIHIVYGLLVKSKKNMGLLKKNYKDFKDKVISD